MNDKGPLNQLVLTAIEGRPTIKLEEKKSQKCGK